MDKRTVANDKGAIALVFNWQYFPKENLPPPPSAVLVYYLLERWQIYMYQTSFYDSFMFTLHMGSVRIFALLCYLLKQIYAWKIKIKPFLHKSFTSNEGFLSILVLDYK